MPQNKPATLEVCIDDVSGLGACEAGADRIELCSALGVGGLTPSAGLIAAAKSSRLPVHAMIRPRVGDFAFSAAEVDVMLSDIAAVKSAGLHGVVLGATRGDGLDLAVLTRLRDAAGSLECTLHRAIDLLPDPFTALEQVIDLGFSRVLTSGGAVKATDGLGRLRAMQDSAAGRIEIMVGSGVTVDNVSEIQKATGIRSFHASCATTSEPSTSASAFGFAPPVMKTTDAAQVTRLKANIAAL